MDVHEFMRQFNYHGYTYPLYDALDARFVNMMSLDGMEFILLDYFVKVDQFSTNWYIFFREIVNGKVLEPAYTIITDLLYDGIEGLSHRRLTSFIGDRLQIIRKIPLSDNHKVHYGINYIESYDYESDTFTNLIKR